MSDQLELSIIGVDGSKWDVSGPEAGAQGVEMLPKTKQLLSDTPAKTFWIKSGGGSQRYQGFNYQRRDPMFGFSVYGRTPGEWRDIDSRFRMALGNYNDQFTCNAVTQPDDQFRELNIRLLQQPDPWNSSWEGKDPHLYCESTVMIDGACETPHWVGPMEVDSWTLPSGTSGSHTFMEANPGDVPIFKRWVVNAPSAVILPDFSYGQEQDFQRPVGADAARTVPLPVLVSGEDSDVDTNDNNEYIVAANGAPVWMRTGGNFAFYPIAPHTPPTAVPFSVSGATTGFTVTLEMDRWYSRAWGVSL